MGTQQCCLFCEWVIVTKNTGRVSSKIIIIIVTNYFLNNLLENLYLQQWFRTLSRLE